MADDSCLLNALRENIEKFTSCERKTIDSWVKRLFKQGIESTGVRKEYKAYLTHMINSGSIHDPFLSEPPATSLPPLEEYFMNCDEEEVFAEDGGSESDLTEPEDDLESVDPRASLAPIYRGETTPVTPPTTSASESFNLMQFTPQGPPSGTPRAAMPTNMARARSPTCANTCPGTPPRSPTCPRPPPSRPNPQSRPTCPQAACTSSPPNQSISGIMTSMSNTPSPCQMGTQRPPLSSRTTPGSPRNPQPPRPGNSITKSPPSSLPFPRSPSIGSSHRASLSPDNAPSTSPGSPPWQKDITDPQTRREETYTPCPRTPSRARSPCPMRTSQSPCPQSPPGPPTGSGRSNSGSFLAEPGSSHGTHQENTFDSGSSGFRNMNLLELSPFFREKRRHEGREVVDREVARSVVEEAAKNAPGGGEEDPRMIQKMIDGITEDTQMLDFILQVGPYTRDKGITLRDVVRAEMTDFRNLVGNVLETKKMDIGDGLASEQMAITNRYAIAARQKEVATEAIKNTIYKLMPDFNMKTYEEEGEPYVRDLVEKRIEVLRAQRESGNWLSEAKLRTEMLNKEAERLERLNASLLHKVMEGQNKLNAKKREQGTSQPVNYMEENQQMEAQIQVLRQRLFENSEHINCMIQNDKSKCWQSPRDV